MELSKPFAIGEPSPPTGALVAHLVQPPPSPGMTYQSSFLSYVREPLPSTTLPSKLTTTSLNYQEELREMAYRRNLPYRKF